MTEHRTRYITSDADLDVIVDIAASMSSQGKSDQQISDAIDNYLDSKQRQARPRPRLVAVDGKPCDTQ
jgi:hypothetical protein